MGASPAAFPEPGEGHADRKWGDRILRAGGLRSRTCCLLLLGRHTGACGPARCDRCHCPPDAPASPSARDPHPAHPARDLPSTNRWQQSHTVTSEAVTEPGSAGHAPWDLVQGRAPRATCRTPRPHGGRQPAPAGSWPRSPARNAGPCRPSQSHEEPREVLGWWPAGPTALRTRGGTAAPAPTYSLGVHAQAPGGARAGPPAETIWAATARKALVTAVSECGDTFSCRATLR